MGPVKRRDSIEEFARRGDAIDEEEILPKLAPKDVGKFLAPDIETDEYEIAKESGVVRWGSRRSAAGGFCLLAVVSIG